MNGDKQTMHMEDRQRVDQHIATSLRSTGGLPTPIVFEHERVAQQVAVSEHGTFAAARGAAGVQNSGQVIGLTRHGFMLIALHGGPVEQAAGAVVVQGEHMLCTGLERNLADPAKIGPAAHHHGRLCVANEILDLGTLVGGVERQKDTAGAQTCQIKHHGFDRFFDLNGHPAALGQIQRLQQIGHHGR